MIRNQHQSAHSVMTHNLTAHLQSQLWYSISAVTSILIKSSFVANLMFGRKAIWFFAQSDILKFKHYDLKQKREQGNCCSKGDRHLVSLAGKVSVYRAGGLGSIPGRIITQGLKIIEEKVLPLP